jgi:hypothetical protein
MAIYMKLYFPVLMTCCQITVVVVVWWVCNGGGIDLGPPNARTGPSQ